MLRHIVQAVFCAVTPAQQTEEKKIDDETGGAGESSGYSARNPDNATYPSYLFDLS